MSIIPCQFCEDCAENENHPVPAEHELDSWGSGSGGGGFLCDNCYTNRAERAYEGMLNEFYGGSGPQSIRELTEDAYKPRRELRKHDHNDR